MKITVVVTLAALLTVGLADAEAQRWSADLTARFRSLCREVSIAPAAWSTLQASDDDFPGMAWVGPLWVEPA